VQRLTVSTVKDSQEGSLSRLSRGSKPAQAGRVGDGERSARGGEDQSAQEAVISPSGGAFKAACACVAPLSQEKKDSLANAPRRGETLLLGGRRGGLSDSMAQREPNSEEQEYYHRGISGKAEQEVIIEKKGGKQNSR